MSVYIKELFILTLGFVQQSLIKFAACRSQAGILKVDLVSLLFVFNILLGGKLVLLSSGGLLKVFTLFDVV